MLNKTLLIGRLTEDPQLRYMPSGTPVASFGIAVNENYKGKDGNWREETYFFDVDTIGELANRVAKNIGKGTQVLIEGKLVQDRWESNGQKRSKVKIVAKSVKVLRKPQTEAKQAEIETEEEDLGIDTAETEDFTSDDDVPF